MVSVWKRFHAQTVSGKVASPRPGTKPCCEVGLRVGGAFQSGWAGPSHIETFEIQDSKLGLWIAAYTYSLKRHTKRKFLITQGSMRVPMHHVTISKETVLQKLNQKGQGCGGGMGRFKQQSQVGNQPPITY